MNTLALLGAALIGLSLGLTGFEQISTSEQDQDQ